MSTYAKPTSRTPRRFRGRFFLAGLTLSLVPASYVASIALSGASSALACLPQRLGITNFSLPHGDIARPLAVAKDGFFVINVYGTFATPSELLESVAVTVTNAAGAPVPGTLHPLASQLAAYWLANAELDEGAYTVTLSAPSKPELMEQSATLAVKGERTELALPIVEPKTWIEYHQLTGGKRLSCNAPGLCVPNEFGEQQTTAPGVQVSVRPSQPINGQVYWEVYLKPAGDADTGTRSTIVGTLMRDGDEAGDDVRFTEWRPEYCVVVTVRDLRDDRELSSVPTCWKPGPLEVWDETSIIGSCQEPPTPALLPLWCKHRGGVPTQCQGIDVTGTAGVGSAGTVGHPELPANAGAGGLVPTGGNRDDDGDSSRACSVGHSRAHWQLGIATWLAFLAFGTRRRMRGCASRIGK